MFSKYLLKYLRILKMTHTIKNDIDCFELNWGDILHKLDSFVEDIEDNGDAV